VSTEFEKYSFGEKWNSKTKPFKEIVHMRNMSSSAYYSSLGIVRINAINIITNRIHPTE
jgi:hypothetical protein